MQKRVLICGGTGFIGANLVEYFSSHPEYITRATHFSRSPLPNFLHNVQWVHADLRIAEDVRRVMEDVDIVLQYAATTTGAKDIVSKPYIHVTDNVVINSLLLREAFEQDIDHFIMPSCSIMYQPNIIPVKESDFDASDNIYPKYFGAGNTKVYLEKMCDFFSRFDKKTKYTVLRQSNIYGPYDKYELDKSHVFGATITKTMTATEKITVWGTGKEERDFLYVSDLVDLIDTVLKNQITEFELVNASGGYSISVADLVRKIVNISGKRLNIEYDTTKPSILTKLAVDNRKALDLYGWSPSTKLDDGIDKCISWCNKNGIF